jgi:hypothetical protein
MEVHSNYEILKAGYPKKSVRNQESVNKEFGAILDESIAETSQMDTGTRKTAMVDSMAGIQFDSSLSLNENPIIEQTGRLLDTLDNYREKLQNPEVSLADIKPLVSEMEMKKEGLTAALNSLPDGDGLKDVLNEAMITSSLEAAKFNRGDYTS